MSPAGHKARDEMHVAEQAIQLRHDNGRLGLAGLRQRRGKLRATVEFIGTLAGLHLDKLAQRRQALGCNEAGYGPTSGGNRMSATLAGRLQDDKSVAGSPMICH
jgi:hypothetical protein